MYKYDLTIIFDISVPSLQEHCSQYGDSDLAVPLDVIAFRTTRNVFRRSRWNASFGLSGTRLSLTRRPT